MITIEIDSSSLTNIGTFLERFPDVTRQSLSIAINETARQAVIMGRDRILGEVDFPPGYLNSDRLFVATYARPDSLEATVEGKDSPTSLVRFTRNAGSVPQARGRGQRGSRIDPTRPIVGVHPGVAKLFNSGFFIGLSSGNVGFAIRLKPGESVVKGVDRFTPIQLFPDTGHGAVFLLYGPSVDQVWAGVAIELVGVLNDALEKEFGRQFALRLGGTQRGG